MRSPIALLGLVAFMNIPALAQDVGSRVLRPEGPGAPRTFWRDSLAQRIELDRGTLEVLAERSRTNPNVTTGKYVVRWNGRQIAVGDDQSLVAGAPKVAAVYAANPTVVVLSTYTGGQGIPGYYVKLVVLEPDRQGSASPRVFSLGATEEVGSDRFSMLHGPDEGEFVIGSVDFALNYSHGVLRVEPAQAAAAPVPDPAEREYVAAMKSDLRNLVTAQEAYFADSVKYTARFGQLGYHLSSDNRLLSLRVTADGWTAIIGNAKTRIVCAIFVGSTPVPPATTEGGPACQ